MGLSGGGGRRIAVLSKKDLTTHPYDRWLTGSAAEVVLFAEDNAATRAALTGGHGYADVRLFADWKRNRAVDEAVLAEHRRGAFDRVVALSECDQLRAAELRERLGLAGQHTASATAFRDKGVMKELAARAEVGLPAYRVVDQVGELVDFVDGVAGPVVVKPVDGAGSVGVAVLRGRGEVAAWVAGQPVTSDDPAGFLVEEWIDAPMLSVDGLMRDGRVVAAMVGAYTVTCLSSLTTLEPSGILLLDADDPRACAAVECTARLLAALPAAADLRSFHAELFDTAGRGLLLCEVACRTGGGNLDLMARQMLGVGLDEAACLGQAGGDVAVPRSRPAPGRVLGDLLVPRSQLRWPQATRCGLPGVLRFAVHHDRMTDDQPRRAVKASDYVIDALLEADTHAELRRRYDDLATWIRDTAVHPTAVARGRG